MNTTSSPKIPEICNHEITSMSLSQKQQIDFKWQQDQLQQFEDPGEVYQNLGGIFAQAMKSDPGLETCWDDYASIGGGLWEYGNLNAFDMSCSVARTLSCPPAVAAAVAEVTTAVAGNGKETFTPEKQSSTSRKRKVEMTLNLQVEREEESKEKKLKRENSITKEQKDGLNTPVKDDNKETSDSTKERSKISEVQKPDYIHVRARRGQATDSHSLAERVRRERISERMKYLQNLVPGCDKITGKAGMLDEIINYVQSLQNQVEFLSMKLAAISPRADSNVENFLTKQVFPASTSQVHPAMEALNKSCLPPNYQPNSLQQVVSSCGLDISVDPPMTLRRTISAPVSIPGTVFESHCFSHLQSCSTWDPELQSIYALEF